MFLCFWFMSPLITALCWLPLFLKISPVIKARFCLNVFFIPFTPVFVKFRISGGVCFWKLKNKMYPKVRVRKQDQEDDDDDMFSPLSEEKGAQLFLKIIDSPVQCHYSPEKENRAESAPSMARIRKPCVSESTTKSFPVSKGTLENKKPSNRACLVTRPRAVLSSPDNDCMIGKRNKLNSERSLELKCKLELKMASQSKVLGSPAKPEFALKESKALKIASCNTTPVKQKGLSKTKASSKASNLPPSS